MEQTLTQEQRSELRAKAQAATRGPWMVLPPVIIGENNAVVTPHDGERHRSIATRALPENAAYIAAADPPAVLALLDALEEAERALVSYATNILALNTDTLYCSVPCADDAAVPRQDQENFSGDEFARRLQDEWRGESPYGWACPTCGEPYHGVDG